MCSSLEYLVKGEIFFSSSRENIHFLLVFSRVPRR